MKIATMTEQIGARCLNRALGNDMDCNIANNQNIAGAGSLSNDALGRG